MNKNEIIEKKKEMEIKPYIEDWKRTNFNYALVCRGSVKDIEKLKKYIIKIGGLTPIYQKVSTLSLRIEEGD